MAERAPMERVNCWPRRTRPQRNPPPRTSRLQHLRSRPLALRSLTCSSLSQTTSRSWGNHSRNSFLLNRRVSSNQCSRTRRKLLEWASLHNTNRNSHLVHLLDKVLTHLPRCNNRHSNCSSNRSSKHNSQVPALEATLPNPSVPRTLHWPLYHRMGLLVMGSQPSPSRSFRGIHHRHSRCMRCQRYPNRYSNNRLRRTHSASR